MNNSDMIRQLITFTFIVLVSVFIVSEMQWGTAPETDITQNDAAPEVGHAGDNSDGDAALSFSDLRSGGAVRRRPVKAFERVVPEPFEAATSTHFSSATSTPFQSQRATLSQGGLSRDVAVHSRPQLPGADPTPAVKRPPSSASSVTKPPEKLGNEFKDSVSDLTISGHIVDTAGNVISDLPLTLQLVQGTEKETSEYAQKTLNTHSDEQGAYAFVNLVEGTYRVCTVEARGYKPVCQTPRAPHSAADFSLRGTLNGSVYGVVLDEQGAPLKDVSISATPGQKSRATTDEKGKYKLTMTVSEALSYQIYFSKKDYQRERIAARGTEILKGRELSPVLKKTQLNGFEVTGVIYDQSGAPVSGQTVTLYSPTVKSPLALRASSAGNGEFTIKYVAAAKDYRLNVATRGGYSFDGADYQKMEIFEGMSPIQLQVKSGGKASFRARVVQQGGAPLSGEIFTLYSGSAYAGRATSNTNGEIVFEDVPVQEGGNKLRISSTASPRYSFSGMTLMPGVHQSGMELRVDRGDKNLQLIVVDESDQPLQGARAVLTWMLNRDGILSQTSRSRGKTSIAGSGEINFTELGSGEHRLQISLAGYASYSQPLNINQANQTLKVVLKTK